MSSVAMMTASNFLARRQRSQTCRRSGLFAIRCSGLPAKRVDAQRAGIIPTALLICCLDNDFGRYGQILSHPVGATPVDQIVSELARNLGLHRAILLFGEEASPDAALIGDDNDFVSGVFQSAQGRTGSFKNLNLFRIGAVIGVVHNGAVAINEDGA